MLLNTIRKRLAECKLELHPEKTKLVYCINGKRKTKETHLKFGCFFREVLLSEIHYIREGLRSSHLSTIFFKNQISTQIFYLNFM
jgi:hypothetical protein